jgi:hypothetical protein
MRRAKGIESRSQRAREANNNDSEDTDVLHAHVMPQHLNTMSQRANDKAADTSNANTNGAGMVMPVGTLNRLPCKSNEKRGKGAEVDEGVEEEDE